MEALPAWRVILAAIRFRPRLWLIDLAAVFLVRMLWQVAPGLVMRAFFDLLAGETAAGLNIWSIVALLVAMEVGQQIAYYGFLYADVPLFADLTTLLRHNLLRHILHRPGASALPDSPGEAVSRFRGDVTEIPLFAIWINDILVGVVVVLVAVGAIAVLVIRTTDVQFRRYITHSGMQASGSGLEQLITYYQQQGSWEGVERLLDQGIFLVGPGGIALRAGDRRPGRPGGHLDIMLADAGGRVVYDSAREAQGRKLKSGEKSQAF